MNRGVEQSIYTTVIQDLSLCIASSTESLNYRLLIQDVKECNVPVPSVSHYQKCKQGDFYYHNNVSLVRRYIFSMLLLTTLSLFVSCICMFVCSGRLLISSQRVVCLHWLCHLG